MLLHCFQLCADFALHVKSFEMHGEYWSVGDATFQ